MSTLVLVLGDQLSARLSSLDVADADDSVVLMVEVAEETTYVPHHKKKIAFLLSAMRHHALALQQAGWQVDYVRLDDPGNTGSFTGEVARAIKRHRPSRVLVTHPGEWRVLEAMRAWQSEFGLPVEIREDSRFFCRLDEFAAWAGERRNLRMEFFYHEIRRKTGLLMDNGKPVGGRWNYDSENRKGAEADLLMPRPARFTPDAITEEVLDLVERRFADHPGTLRPFWFAVTADDADDAMEHFLADALHRFGDYQDAMLDGQPFLYHSVLSIYINAGLIDPLTLCQRVEAAYHAGQAPLNAVEGYIRQVIGWREYMRGVYWLKMPEYRTANALAATRKLPWFYWSGETDMACVKAAVDQTLAEAYAHHIQRLMITGTFALLAGLDPHEVHEWYLAVYADAYEWVELPNTIGMSQFADGGLLASKPYAASGAYIDRMSDYCKNCRYDVRSKTGPDACPFNSLYWDFLDRHRTRLKSNPRLGPMYRNWDRMTEESRAAYRSRAAVILGRLDRAERV